MAAGAVLFGAAAHAQDCPNRPITVIAPFGPGGATLPLVRPSRATYKGAIAG